MNSIAISSIILACVFGSALLGMFLSKVLPPEQLGHKSAQLITMGMGLIGTMAAMVLGLLLASAKTSYDTEKGELTALSARVIFLDRVLAHYGPETKEARDALRIVVASTLDQGWSGSRSRDHQPRAPLGADAFYDELQELSPKTDEQRAAKAEALSLVIALGQTRWLMLEQANTQIPMPLLVAVVFWLTLIFLSFGLIAPRNATVIATLFICALSVSIAVLLILELYSPFGGWIRISDAPLQRALTQLGR